MAFSENWDLITLSGTYLNSDGSPVQGAVVLTPTPVRMVDLAALKTVIGNQMRIPLDANGHFSVQVPATDDPDITPINFTYQVKEDFPGGATYHIEVPFETEGELNIATIAPQAEASPGELVATVPGPQGPQGEQGERGPIGVSIEAIIQAGNLIVKNNVLPPGQRMPADASIEEFHLRIGSAPTGQDARVRVNRTRAGSTTELGTYSITAGTNAASFGVSWAVQTGDILTYDVTQTGTTVIGADLAAQIVGTGG